ncbi:GNAT family N-acetyltransferase [Flexibacterium corallicola]|uniref:GNAT family N-acetyltransferase n=1 Tax=Flexibacterium corallicola TaxID=3037259 RepID=UPI00286EDBDB|nr:GNAT family N-acetyltransferase [Pseudovibrio sp. M1P-2-3]
MKLNKRALYATDALEFNQITQNLDLIKAQSLEKYLEKFQFNYSSGIHLDLRDFPWPAHVEVEKGFEDIFSTQPYIKAWEDESILYIDMLYVPPSLRGTGIGTQLAKSTMAQASSLIQRVRLRSAALGSGHTMPFWKSLGFQPAYDVTRLSEDIDNVADILVMGLNNHPTPAPIPLTDDSEFRDIIEHIDDTLIYETDHKNESYPSKLTVCTRR